jgi:hypothetical protein
MFVPTFAYWFFQTFDFKTLTVLKLPLYLRQKHRRESNGLGPLAYGGSKKGVALLQAPPLAVRSNALGTTHLIHKLPARRTGMESRAVWQVYYSTTVGTELTTVSEKPTSSARLIKETRIGAWPLPMIPKQILHMDISDIFMIPITTSTAYGCTYKIMHRPRP